MTVSLKQTGNFGLIVLEHDERSRFVAAQIGTFIAGSIRFSSLSQSVLHSTFCEHSPTGTQHLGREESTCVPTNVSSVGVATDNYL